MNRYFAVLFLSWCLMKVIAQAQSPESLYEVPRDEIVPGGALDFRAMIHYYDLSNYDQVNARITEWAAEGYNAIIWGTGGEFWGGVHALVRHKKFPEARELPDEEIEKKIANLNRVFTRSRELRMKNLFYTQEIFYTKAFGRAHDLMKPMPESTTVHDLHNVGYGNDPEAINLGVRNELTSEYTKALFKEMLETYKDLDGFYSPIGEPLPGDRGTFFREVLAPALKESGRHPLIIAHQWQVPLDTYLKNIAPKEVYDNTWLGFHAWNSEQITTPAPVPGLVYWARRVGIPTVATVYPANIQTFPWNSPLWAWDITQEMRRVPHFKGFAYFELSGHELSPLFRKALGYYAEHNEPYSDEPWLKMLNEEYGSEETARHFLEAFKASANIYPDLYALVYNGSDLARKELRLPYVMLGRQQNIEATAPERGGMLIPIAAYIHGVVHSPGYYEDYNGEDFTRRPFRQQAIWGSHGGAIFDILPPVHMQFIRRSGEKAAREAEAGLPAATKNQEEARRIVNFMKGYELMGRYFERKVMAGIYAQVFAKAKRPADKEKALKFADEAVTAYEEAVAFLKQNLEADLNRIYGKGYNQGGDLDALLKDEHKDREEIGKTFNWPANS